MPVQPTYDDVNLILKLYELRREERMRKARAWFAKYKASSIDEHLKHYPPGSEEDASFRMVTTYWEMVASFVTAGVLNQELFLESGGELLFVWEKIREMAPSWRSTSKNPTMMANLEKVAQAAIERMNRANPEAYALFSARIKGMAA
jgi:hypothetical protein